MPGRIDMRETMDAPTYPCDLKLTLGTKRLNFFSVDLPAEVILDGKRQVEDTVVIYGGLQKGMGRLE